MALSAHKRKPATQPATRARLYHASVLVTRAEEWCVEAASAQEARALLASGQGDRCHLGDCLNVELDALLDDE